MRSFWKSTATAVERMGSNVRLRQPSPSHRYSAAATCWPCMLYISASPSSGHTKTGRHSSCFLSIHACIVAAMPHQGWCVLAVWEGAGHGGAALAAGKVHLQDERPDAADAHHCAAYGHQAPCTIKLICQGARRARLPIYNAQDADAALALHGKGESHAVKGAIQQLQSVIAFVGSVLHIDAALQLGRLEERLQ